jgi:hypothetical protein
MDNIFLKVKNNLYNWLFFLLSIAPQDWLTGQMIVMYLLDDPLRHWRNRRNQEKFQTINIILFDVHVILL